MYASKGAVKIHYHVGDLPADVSFGDAVAIDTETQGLLLGRDRLCVAQLSSGDGTAHLVHFIEPNYDAPNLKRVIADTSVTKIFHYARFDVAAIKKYLEIDCTPVFCTKIASKLVRTYTDRHGLKNICSELLGVDLSKEQQSSDWAAAELSKAQREYAANDVLYLHALRAELQHRLERENRVDVAQACFDFLPARAALDLNGWGDQDIFHH